jgi:flavorubredoxin
MITTSQSVAGIDVITSIVSIPTLGSLPINAFVVHGASPMLVDTGSIVDSDDFMTALRSVIDPSDLRWIWLTHTDFDHIGSLQRLLAENSQLRVVTSFLGVGIMGLFDPLPMDRVFLINPGQTLTLEDRTLTAVKPPVYDNPITTGFYDSSSGALFSSDCFGAVLADVPTSATDVDPADLRAGQTFWTTVDSSWIHNADAKRFAERLDAMRAVEPSTIFSAHLPPAPGTMLEQFLDSLEAARTAEPFVGPDQVMLEAMLAGAPAGDAQ